MTDEELSRFALQLSLESEKHAGLSEGDFWCKAGVNLRETDF